MRCRDFRLLILLQQVRQLGLELQVQRGMLGLDKLMCLQLELLLLLLLNLQEVLQDHLILRLPLVLGRVLIVTQLMQEEPLDFQANLVLPPELVVEGEVVQQLELVEMLVVHSSYLQL